MAGGCGEGYYMKKPYSDFTEHLFIEHAISPECHMKYHPFVTLQGYYKLLLCYCTNQYEPAKPCYGMREEQRDETEKL